MSETPSRPGAITDTFWADAPPPESDYRPTDSATASCGQCENYVSSGDHVTARSHCSLWEANVSRGFVCDSFEPLKDSEYEEYTAPDLRTSFQLSEFTPTQIVDTFLADNVTPEAQDAVSTTGWHPVKHPRLQRTTLGQRGGTFITKANIEKQLAQHDAIDVSPLAKGSQRIAHVQIYKTPNADQTLMLVRLRIEGQQGTYDVGMYVPTANLEADKLQRVLIGLDSGLPINDLVRKEKVFKVSNDEKHYSAYTQYVRAVASRSRVAASEEGGRVTVRAEIYCADASTQTEDGLLWKVALPVGDLKIHPNYGGLRPFRVIEGKSADSKQAIGLQDIVEAFDQGAVQHVTVPTSHRDSVEENTGFVRKLKVGNFTDAKGVSRRGLLAGMEIRDKTIKGKIEDGTIANCSVGLEFDYVRKDDGTKFPVVLKHNCLTNKPFVPGMPAFERIAASEDGDGGGGDGATSTIEVMPMESMAEKPTRKGFTWRMEKAREALTAMGLDMIIDDINEDTLLVVDDQLNEWDVAYDLTNDGLTLVPRESWIKSGVRAAVVDPPTPPTPPEPPAPPEPTPPPAGPQTPEQTLAEAQARRKKLLLSEQSIPDTSKGGDKQVSNTIKIGDIELTEDQVRQLLANDAASAKTKAESKIDGKIEEFKKLGLTEETGWAGFLRLTRSYLLADNGEPAVLLSEEGKSDRTITLSEVVNELISAIPRAAVEALPSLTQQHHLALLGPRPPDVDQTKKAGDRGLDVRSQDAAARADAFRKRAGIQPHLVTS